ncbi:hypothetical protein K439DRAFT_1640743 [Ramaria rubella]|nr:hypothetical protein K439DRAFT_1641535 [Ramaria rubella]KAF8576195.1 hypothetical protein K439DRAFT_1640743 [Ramaria rubella]
MEWEHSSKWCRASTKWQAGSLLDLTYTACGKMSQRTRHALDEQEGEEKKETNEKVTLSRGQSAHSTMR